MRISRVEIENFRNFENIAVETGGSLVLVGANASGKSNFIHALRLVLDSSLSRRDRMLTADDFWRGGDLPPWQGREIRVSVELSDFAENDNLRSLLDSYLTDREGVARLTFLYAPRGNINASDAREQDYEARIVGGNDLRTEVDSSLFRHLGIRFIDALRDASSELIAKRMPLRSLLSLYGVDGDALSDVVEHIRKANDVIGEKQEIISLEHDIRLRLEDMKEHIHDLSPVVRLLADGPGDVLSALRVLLDADRLMALGNTSLGLSNLLFLAMSLLEIEKRESSSTPSRDSEYQYIILGLEEPEAHLHPHLQRLIFRDFLRRDHAPIILSTHSPHLASVAPIQSIVMLRQPSSEQGAQVISASRLTLSESEKRDIERYLDVSRAEMLFSRAVLLVEGESEAFLLPALARLCGYDLDRHGITVCNIFGTNFAPYVKLLGPEGLQIPFAVLTDGDKFTNLRNIAIPQGSKQSLLTYEQMEELRAISSDIELRDRLESYGVAYYYGLKRAIDLMDAISNTASYSDELRSYYERAQWEIVRNRLAGYGIFANEWTLEASLVDSGFADLLLEVLSECGAGTMQAGNLRDGLEIEKFTAVLMKQINSVGKGRLAQRLSTRLAPGSPGLDALETPAYIVTAIEYLVGLLNNTVTYWNFEDVVQEEDDIPF